MPAAAMAPPQTLSTGTRAARSGQHGTSRLLSSSFFSILTFWSWFFRAGDPLFDELWHACAGPLVTVPRVGDLVFYFPQGHIEQVPASFRPPRDSPRGGRSSAIRALNSLVPDLWWCVFCFQVEASMNQVAGNQMRLYDLPSKLLCRVINVELKVPLHPLTF
jgi:hypothetical protein